MRAVEAAAIGGRSARAARRAALVLAASVAAGSAACGSSQPAPPAEEQPAAAAPDTLARGRYLTEILACGDCHTPFKMGPNGPEPDLEKGLSGHPEDLKMTPPPDLGDGPWGWVGAMTNTAFAGPWGVSYAINLTPDRDTGMGIWTEEMFVNAIRTGRHFGISRPIAPPMPWAAYRQLTDEDLKALFAYLKSLEPIRNRVPAFEPPASAP